MSNLFVRKATGMVRSWSVFDAFIYAFFSINLVTLGFYSFSQMYYFSGGMIPALIISAVLSWLVAFNVVNTQNRFIYLAGDFFHRITDPVLRPLRRFIPTMGGIDVSPVVLILGLIFVRNLVWEYLG